MPCSQQAVEEVAFGAFLNGKQLPGSRRKGARRPARAVARAGQGAETDYFNALLVLVRHFAPSDRYFEDDREPPYLQTKESFTAWAKANNFDLGKMRADYRRDKR